MGNSGTNDTGANMTVQLFNFDEPVTPPPPVGKYIAGLTIPEGITERQFREVVGAVHTAYVGDGVLPDVNRIKEICRLTTVTKKVIGKILASDQFEEAMKARGVPWKSSGLTGQQMLVLQLVTDVTDRRDLGRKLKSVGVTPLQYRTWLKEPHFSSYLQKISGNAIAENVPALTTALVNKALSGDLRAIQYAFEVSGHHDPDRQQVADLKIIMQQLIEIITRNVKDPETLSKISNELHLTLVGQGVIKGEIGK